MLSIGLIGFGYWGHHWARILSNSNLVNLKAICDSQLEFNDSSYDCPFYNFIDDFFSHHKFDAVILATPAGTHEKLVYRCLEEDCHVLFEKPLALSYNDAKKIAQEAHRRQLLVMPDHTYLYSPVIDYLFKQGEFIRELFSLRMNWGIFRRDVDVIWDLAIHDVSITNYLFNEMPQAVLCSGHHLYHDEQMSSASLTLFYSANRSANIQVSWTAPEKQRYMTCAFNDSGQSMIWNDLEKSYPLKVIEKCLRQEKRQYIDESIELGIELPKSESLENLLIDFVGAIDYGRIPKANVMDHLNCLRVLEAAEASIAHGKTVFIS